MLYVFGFDRLGIVLSDLYFLDPHPGPGQEGPERGVRMELRFLESAEHEGTIYASRRIAVGRPLWRADLLESVESPGSLDRAHHHPSMRGWEPGGRKFERDMSADPVSWVREQLAHPEQLVEAAGVGSEGLDADLSQIRAAAGEIVETIGRMLERIAKGELAQAPDGSEGAELVRSGWL